MSALCARGQRDVFFELPESSIRGIPLYSGEGEHLSLGFVEVGCRPDGKRGQLKDKRQLLYHYWGVEYRGKHHLPWYPVVYRMIPHYDPTNPSKLDVSKFSIDTALIYRFITPAMLVELTPSEHKEIASKMRSEPKRVLLEEILRENDADYWNRVIFRSRTDFEITNVRGKMAEILALKDIGRCVPSGMSLYKNEDIRYFNRRYRNGTEIDGILTFYGERPYVELIDNLRRLPYLIVKDRWH